MTALYRKYRPQSFSDLQGQSAVRTTLTQALKQNKLVHAYLFSGPRGTGKTTTARLIAKAIQCEKRLETGEPCETCEICVLNNKGELIDLVEIDAASNRGIDEIRDLREKIRFAPTRAKSKVYIIDEVHMLTKEAFNALLKSLEEPPSHVYFILATTEIHKIPETIISRCQRYEFKRISERDLADRLRWIAEKEGLEAEPAALELLAKYAEGGMRDAISIFEQLATEPLTEELVRERLGLTNHQSCEELFAALGSADTQKGLGVIENLYKDGYDLQQFTTALLGLLRSKLHSAVLEKKHNVIPKLLAWVELFDEAWMKLKKASIATLPLEMALIRATHSSDVSVPATPVEARLPEKQLVPVEQTKRAEGLVHLDAIKKQLPKIYENISTPAVRSSFQTGQVKDLRGKQVVFVFTTQFHLQKVQMPSAFVEVETALQKVLGSDFKIVFELEEASAPARATVPLDAESMGWDTVEEPL